MRFSATRRLLLLALVTTGLLGTTELAVAACPPPPPPPSCGTPGFTGRPGTTAPRCGNHRSPPICRDTRGPRGPRGAPGKEGPAGPRGPGGADGPRGQAGPRGEAGVAGAAGAAGPPGSTGAPGTAGAAGPQGLRGVQGETGAEGATGATGSQGATGSTGAEGAQGETGTQGVAGAEGAEGQPGAIGETGEAGPEGSNGLSQYAYFYNLGTQSVALEEDVTFDTDGLATAGITHSSGSDEIVILEAGIYEVSFSVSGTEPSQMAIFVNGVLVPGTIYGSGAGTQQNSGQAIFAVPAGGILTIRNHTSTAAVTLAPAIGGTQPTSNASVVILKLA